MTYLWPIYITWSALLCWHDVRERRLPNVWTLGGAVLFLVLQYLQRGLPGMASGVGAGMVAGLFLLVPWLIRAAGGGDVKMMLAAGAAVGWPGLVSLLVLSSLAGLVMATVMLMAGAVNPARLKHLAHCAFNPRYDRRAGAAALPSVQDERVRIPYSLAIAMGMLVTLGTM